MTEEITIGGRKILMEHTEVPLDRVELDPKNPRLQYILSTVNGKTVDEIVLQLPQVRSLLKDIANTGGLRERVYLQIVEKGKYIVREGNCRTVCYRALRQEDSKSPAWKKIPAKVLPPDISEREVAILLSDWHVAGKIRWNAHEKAGQVHKMANELGMTLEEIASNMRSSKSTVQRANVAYSLMFEVFMRVDDGAYRTKGEQKFSYFDEFFKRKELRDAYAADSDFGETFCRWVGEGRIGPPVNVRKLAKIVSLPRALKKFESGASIEEAFKLVADSEPEVDSDFFKLLSKVRTACTSAASLQDVLRVREDKIARKRLRDTYKSLVKFMELANLDPEALAEQDE
jgi:hypothetical protein